MNPGKGVILTGVVRKGAAGPRFNVGGGERHMQHGEVRVGSPTEWKGNKTGFALRRKVLAYSIAQVN